MTDNQRLAVDGGELRFFDVFWANGRFWFVGCFSVNPRRN